MRFMKECHVLICILYNISLTALNTLSKHHTSGVKIAVGMLASHISIRLQLNHFKRGVIASACAWLLHLKYSSCLHFFYLKKKEVDDEKKM